MSANTETTGGPPKGYVECRKKCGRWHEETIDGTKIPYTSCAPCWNAHSPGRGTAATWTPPIAAPAAHVERRKGQRWKCQDEPDDDGVVGELIERIGSCWDVMVNGRRELWADCPGGSRWRDCTMTLLADATPGPAKPWCVSCGCGNDTEGYAHMPSCPNAKSPPAQEVPKPKCEICGARGFLNEAREHPLCPAHAQAEADAKREAQEAPKAAPVCSRQLPSMSAPIENPAKKERSTSQSDAMCFDAGGTKCGGPVLTRHLPAYLGASGLRNLCDNHVLMRELSIAKSIGPQTGKPYAGPERLPRPQLAADWVEDCLPESDR